MQRCSSLRSTRRNSDAWSAIPRVSNACSLNTAARGGPSAIAANGAAQVVIIPAAANAPGANGTYFRSDVTITNLNEVVQRILVIWLPQDNPDGWVDFETTLRTTVSFRDFVGSELGLSGVGALVFASLDEKGDIDLDGAIDVYSRIWSPSANGAPGTFSQSFQGVDVLHFFGARSARMPGLRNDSEFRTNYGIFNLSNRPLRFRVVADAGGWGETVEEVNLAVSEMILRPVSSAVWVDSFLTIELIGSVPEEDIIWTALQQYGQRDRRRLGLDRGGPPHRPADRSRADREALSEAERAGEVLKKTSPAMRNPD